MLGYVVMVIDNSKQEAYTYDYVEFSFISKSSLSLFSLNVSGGTERNHPVGQPLLFLGPSALLPTLLLVHGISQLR